MRLVKTLLLLAAAVAVVGFVLVAVGQNSQSDKSTDGAIPDGWYAYDPRTEADKITNDPDAAYSSTMSVTSDDESDKSTTTAVGFGLVGLSFLLTAGLIGYWAVTRPKPSV